MSIYLQATTPAAMLPGVMLTHDTMLSTIAKLDADCLCVGNTAVKYLLKLLGMRDNPVGQLVPLLKLWCDTA